MAKVNLALLGGFRLQTDSGEPVPLSTKKAGALLAYLALHPGQAQARPKLAALLWGDRSEVQARDSLRQALSLVRKALSQVDSRALTAHEDTISFEPMALTTDAIVFGDLAAQEETESLEQAIALYGGELLDGFEVAAPEFESWVTAERERFREMALEVMTRLLDHHLSKGAVEGGIRIAARLLAADPLQERVHRTLMELYCRQGRHGAALRQYRTCADLLAKELGIDPDATTKALRREILREWSQRKGATSGGDAAAKSLGDVDETEAPAMPRSPERRHVTVLACDLVGTSALAARLDPEELQALITAYQGCCMPIISRSGGVAGRHSGTEMLAYFGHPQAHEHDIECAVRAGLTLVDAVSRLDGGSAGSLQLRVGIATGPVVVGDLIGVGADQHVIIGEAVQLAGALERIAEPNTVVIAASTRRLVGNLFDCVDLGQMELNGFCGPVPAWRVLGPSGIDSRFEALRAPTTPLIGRDEELDLLLRRWRQAAHGDGRVVLLSGEPGIGKSRLTVELQERLQSEAHTCLRYFCSPHYQDSTLYPIISQLQGAAGFRRDDTDEQRLDRLEAVLARATNDLGDDARLVADLLSVPTGGRYACLDLTPQKRKEKTLRVLLAQLEGLAAQQPVLVVFEDVHWTDPTSLELLDLIVDRVSTIRVLLIITYRPEFAPPWIGRPQVTLLTLNRLLPAQRAEMIAAVTGGKALPLEIADQIIDRADGVPLFIEELTKSVVESGHLMEANDRYALTGPAAPVSLPLTLQGSLLARLDRLPETREVAQIGAALGRSFSHELMSAVAQMPRQHVDDALARLVHAELIFRRGSPPDAAYTFKHALVQDVAYGTLSRSQRQLLHARITKTMEDQFPDTVATEPALLAHHCAEAGSIGKAISYRRKAGQLAIARSAMTEAEVQLRKGLGLLANLPGGPERDNKELSLQIALGLALFVTQGYGAPSAGKALDRARQLYAGMDRAEHQRSVIMTGQFAYRLYRAELRSAYQLSQELLDLGKTWKDSGAPPPVHTSKTMTSVGYTSRGQCRVLLGDFAAARADAEKALRLSDPAVFDAARLHGYWNIDAQIVPLMVCIESQTYLGHLDQACQKRDEALACAHQIKHAATLAFVLSCIAGCEAHIETDPAILLDHVLNLESFCVRHGFALWERSAKWQRGCYLIALGRTAEAAELHAEAGAELRTAGSFLYKPTWLMSLADALGKAGRPKDGLNELEDAAHQIEATEERWAESNMYRIRGELLIALDDFAEAEASFRQAIEIARRQSARLWELRAATCLARLWRDQGRRKQADDLLAPIYSWFTEGLDTPVLREARVVLEQLADST